MKLKCEVECKVDVADFEEECELRLIYKPKENIC